MSTVCREVLYHLARREHPIKNPDVTRYSKLRVGGKVISRVSYAL